MAGKKKLSATEIIQMFSDVGGQKVYLSGIENIAYIAIKPLLPLIGARIMMLMDLAIEGAIAANEQKKDGAL